MVLVTHYLTTMTKTTSSAKTVVGKGGSGEFGKWKSCAVFHVVVGIRVPARAQPGVPHVLLLAGCGDAQPLDEGLQPWELRR